MNKETRPKNSSIDKICLEKSTGKEKKLNTKEGKKTRRSCWGSFFSKLICGPDSELEKSFELEFDNSQKKGKYRIPDNPASYINTVFSNGKKSNIDGALQKSGIERIEEHRASANQREYIVQAEPISLNNAPLENDQKFNANQVLQKLGSDAVNNQQTLEPIDLERGVFTSSKLGYRNTEKLPPQTNQLEIKPSTPPKSTSLNIAFLYNDQKLNTKNVLQKLQDRIINNRHNLEVAHLERGIFTPMTKQPDIIFYFYFITNGREQFEEIEARIGTISTTFPKVPIHLILLKDENCRDLPLDKSKLETLKVTTSYFAIYSHSFAGLTLSPEEFTKPTLKKKRAEVSRNYDELCKNMSAKLVVI